MIIEINSKEDYLNLKVLNSSSFSFDFDSNPFNKYLLYVKDNCIYGFLCYEHIFDRYELDNLFVEVTKRRKGIGLMLLNFLIENGKKCNIINITLEVNKENIPAISLYKKVGFVEKAIRAKYYNGIDGILMEKEMI